MTHPKFWEGSGVPPRRSGGVGQAHQEVWVAYPEVWEE